MKRKIVAEKSVVEEISAVYSTDLAAVASHAQPKIGTVSFPVRGKPIYAPVSNNTALVVEVIQRRQPAILLCAGWTVPTERCLDALTAATSHVKTVVVVETISPTPVYFRVMDGSAVRMGEQFFSTREESDDESRLHCLAGALPERSFTFLQRHALLLNCGEVMVVQGRNHVGFHWSVPDVLRDAVQEPAVMILNPTHTRMGNCGSVQAWRKYLSSGGRVYVSASNWDIDAGQKQSDTLHSLWHDSQAALPTYTFQSDQLCYREWDVPPLV